jgi:hypothetical protein
MTGDGDFNDPAALARVAVNLFYGWGYNFYRLENQLRADDQLVRAKVGWLLGRARAALDLAESAWRQARLPPPSRANPYPDPAALTGARTIEGLGLALGSLAGRIAALPVPEQDRMTRRYREEAATLVRLGEIDQMLVGQAELLRVLLDQKTGPWIIEHAASVQNGLQALGRTLDERQAILQ